MVEEKQNESEIEAKPGALRWRGGVQHRQSSGPQRTIKERRGGGAETETESAKTGWGIDAKAFVRWLPRLASTVVGSARTMQGASHDELNWCCAALPRRLDDHLAKQVESWSWPNRGAKSTG